MNPYDIERIFREIEEDIIKKVIDQFRKDKAKGGAAEFKDWRIRQLKSVRRFIKQLRREKLPWYKRLNTWVKEAIEKAFDDALRKAVSKEERQTIDDGWHGINKTRMDALAEATVNDLADAEAAVFRKTEDEYRKIIYKAEMALNSGMYTYDQSVDMATKDFLKAGINSVVYKNGARHTVQDYAKMVLRTNTKRAAIMAEGEMRTRLGIHTVYARWRGEACPKCLKYLGRIMVDDVYSVGTPDELVGLPEDACMLSEAMAGGFLHPNCLDTIATYDPGLYKEFPESDPLKKDAEYKGLYELRVEKDRKERQSDVYQRMADNQLTESNKKMYAARAEEKREEAEGIERELKQQVKNAKLRDFEDVTQEYLETATPNEGRVNIENGVDKDKRKDEIDGAHMVVEEIGGDITVRAEHDGQKNPDYNWRKALWDLKSTTTEQAPNSAVRVGLGQIAENPGGIILNFGNNEVDLEEVIKTISLRMGWHMDQNIDILIFMKGKLAKALRY